MKGDTWSKRPISVTAHVIRTRAIPPSPPTLPTLDPRFTLIGSSHIFNSPRRRPPQTRDALEVGEVSPRSPPGRAAYAQPPPP